MTTTEKKLPTHRDGKGFFEGTDAVDVERIDYH